MASAATKIGHGLAKGLGIKLDYRDETGTGNAAKLSRGESVFSVMSADSYDEEEPTTGEWFASVWPSKADAWTYVKNLFPFTHWIMHYNLQWLYGDLVAGKSFATNLPEFERALTFERYHNRCCGSTAKYGLRRARTTSPTIRQKTSRLVL
jgi:hypothetical protein